MLIHVRANLAQGHSALLTFTSKDDVDAFRLNVAVGLDVWKYYLGQDGSNIMLRPCDVTSASFEVVK